MPKLCSNARLHMSCIEMDVLTCDWAYGAPKMSWTLKSCACLDSDIPSEKRSNLSYWIYIALFVLSLLLASNGDSGIPHNCWCLECSFSVWSTLPQLAMMKIQMIFTELIAICPSSVHIKMITKLLKLGCRTALQRRWPLWKWRVFVAYLSLAATSRKS